MRACILKSAGDGQCWQSESESESPTRVCSLRYCTHALGPLAEGGHQFFAILHALGPLAEGGHRYYRVAFAVAMLCFHSSELPPELLDCRLMLGDVGFLVLQRSEENTIV
jgi:hypothetical protein